MPSFALTVLLAGALAGQCHSEPAGPSATGGKCLLQKLARLSLAPAGPGEAASASGKPQLADGHKEVMQAARFPVNAQPAEWHEVPDCGFGLLGRLRSPLCRRGGLSWLALPDLALPDYVLLDEAPPADRDLFFRPVSVTMYCLMWLIMQSILLHTGVAVARNADELSALPHPSFVTEVLETAARSVPLVPVMAMLFLANRIYMLESSGGIGEVEIWVKVCMMTATAGMSLQVIVVILLALVADTREGPGFAELAGCSYDAHPDVMSFSFKRTSSRAWVWALQLLSLCAVYGGVTGVALGMVLSGRGFDPTSAAVVSSGILAVLYFAVQAALFLSQAVQGAVREAAMSADAVVQKAPMFAVIFVATRVRQVSEGVAGGVPGPLLSACFPLATLAICLEVLFACLRPQGDRHRRVLSRLKELLAILGLVPACLVLNWIVEPWGLDQLLPLSPTNHSVLGLCMLFLGVHLLMALYSLLRDLLNLTSDRAEDALLRARNSVGFCPLLCALFLGCRMRALQITNNQGMPQPWEPDFLYVCVGATLVEVLCCLTVPLFFKEVDVDQAGNATYKVQSLTGAYCVTLVRYVALLGMHGGVLGVCAAVLTMTPESCLAGRATTLEALHSVARALLWTMLALLLGSLLSSAKVVGLVVKLAIESVDELLLGAEVTVDTAVLSPWGGRIILRGLVVKNPSSGNFRSEHLLTAQLVAVKLDLWRAIKSLGADIDIRELVVNGVELSYEMGVAGGPSNVGALLDFLEGSQKEQPTTPATAATPAATSPAAPGSLVLRRLLVKNVQARVVHPRMGAFAGVDLGTLDITDFSKLSTGRRITDIMVVVLKTLLRTAVSNADIVKTLLQQGTTHVVSSIAGSLKECGCGVPMIASSWERLSGQKRKDKRDKRHFTS